MDQINEGRSRPEYQLTPEIRSYLRETAKWGSFISFLIFISAGLLILAGLGISAFGGALGMSDLSDLEGLEGLGSSSPYFMIGLSFIYIIIGALYFVPGYYLFQFSSKLKLAFKSYNEEALSEAFRNLKSNFKFIGVATIAGIVIYVLFFIFLFVGLVIGGLFG